MLRNILLLATLAFFMCMGVGCCPLTKLNLSIQLDKSFQDKYGMNREILVDVVGVKEAENTRWENYSMTDYWTATDTQRNTPLRKTLTYNSKSLEPQVVWTSDPMWDQWLSGASDKHPPQIYVLAQLPGSWDKSKDDKSGAQDPRRQIISTKSCVNKPGTMIHLVISADHISMQ